jgi:hypothetical protein
MAVDGWTRFGRQDSMSVYEKRALNLV